MKLNRKELKKILYDFNSISNRLMQVDFQDYNPVLMKFINFIKNNEIIYAYIKDCGICEQNLDMEFQEVGSSYGEAIFSLGQLDEEEVRNVFAILCYISEKNLEIHYGVAMGYSASRKYQDKIEGFNDRVVMVLIRHIERYLTKIGIDMGLDEKVTYSIAIESGQVNIANDNSTINATNTVNKIDITKLTELIQTIKDCTESLSEDDEDILASSLEVIQEEASAQTPRKGFLKTSISGLKTIKGTTEFSAAVATLIQFIQPLLQG